MTAYFAVTALTTVRPVSPWTRRINVAALAVAVGLALVDIVGGVKAFNNPRGLLNGVPFVMLFFIATVMILAAAGDLRIMRFGVPRGEPRLARHLWRMCFALFIAAGSFFSIRERAAKILPEPLTTGPMRTLPVLLIFGAMFYWLWRVRRRRTLPVVVRYDPMPLATSRGVNVNAPGNHPTTQTMKNLITNPLTRAALAGVAVWLASVFMAHGQNKPDDLKQRILAQAQSISPDSYAFTRTVKSEQTSNGKTEQHVNIDKFDPTKSGDAKWTLVSVDGAPPAADVLNKYRNESAKRRVPGYYRLAKYFGTAAAVSTDPRGRTVFHFNSLPKDAAIVLDSDVSSNTSADVSVTEANGTAFAEQVHLTVKPMRLKLIMKLDHYESTARYRIGPEGKPLLVESIADMTGSGMGREGKAHTVVTYGDYRAVGR